MLGNSVVVVVVVVRTRPRAIPLAMISMRKSTHGFPLLSRDKYGAPLGGPLGRRSSAIKRRQQLFKTHFLSIAHQLNTYFINVGRELSDKLPTTNENVNQYIKRSFQDRFTFRSILAHEVYDLIMGINLNKSTIGISKKCIKLASSHISEWLTSIFNQSLQQGVVPDILKISKVTPIDKGGEITDPANYCPVSTLSTFTQIFEKFIYNQLINYIENHKIIFQFQFFV